MKMRKRIRMIALIKSLPSKLNLQNPWKLVVMKVLIKFQTNLPLKEKKKIKQKSVRLERKRAGIKCVATSVLVDTP